jgi:hypothetical protein
MLSNVAANPAIAGQLPQVQSQFAQQDMQMQKMLTDIKTGQIKLQSEQIKALNEHADAVGRYATPIAQAEQSQMSPDQINQLYQQARTAAQNAGLDTSELPQQYVPGIGQRLVTQAMSVKDAVSSQHSAATLAETNRHNLASEGNQATERALQVSGQALTKRGQDMTDARSREQNSIAHDTKMEMNKAADTTQLNEFNADMDTLSTKANELLKDPGVDRITGITGKFPTIPGSNAARAEARLANLKNNIAFGVLQKMRNASKTGGALGQVSDNEEKMLANSIAPLEQAQSAEDLKKALGDIVKYADAAKSRAAASIQNKYKSGASANGQHSVGETKQFPNGRTGVWDGNGWVAR